MVEGDPFREHFHTATVIAANPATVTCDILRSEGGMLYGVPIMGSTGGFQHTDAAWASNYRGAVVAYTWIDGRPYIVGTVPVPSKPKEQVSISTTNTGTGGENPDTYAKTVKNQYASGRIDGYMPNDKVMSTDGGSELALLGEGGVVIKASPMSQVIMGSLMDFIHVVAREFKIISDFGELCMSHGASGRLGLSINGGAVYDKEAIEHGSQNGVNTIRMWLGDTPKNEDSRFGIQVNDDATKNFGLMKIDKEGNMAFATTKNLRNSITGHIFTRGNSSEFHEIDNDRTIKVKGNYTSTVLGKEKVVVAGDADLAHNANLSVYAGKNYATDVGKNMTIHVGESYDLQFGTGFSISALSVPIREKEEIPEDPVGDDGGNGGEGGGGSAEGGDAGGMTKYAADESDSGGDAGSAGAEGGESAPDSSDGGESSGEGGDGEGEGEGAGDGEGGNGEGEGGGEEDGGNGAAQVPACIKIFPNGDILVSSPANIVIRAAESITLDAPSVSIPGF